MNTRDVLKYGHLQFLNNIDSAKEVADLPGACGFWSVHNVLAHMTAFEHALNEILLAAKEADIVEANAGEYLIKYNDSNYNFNDDEVTAREGQTLEETRSEYTTLAEHNIKLAEELDVKVLSKTGRIPWYGVDYSIQDFIVYTNYGHKREHGAQVAAFQSAQKID